MATVNKLGRALAHQRDALIRPAESKDHVLGFSRVFFEHVNEYREVFHALVRHGGDAVVIGALRRMLADLVKNELTAATRIGGESAIPRSAAVRFVVDAFLSVMLWWIDQKPPCSPAKADGIFRRLTVGTLTSARLA